MSGVIKLENKAFRIVDLFPSYGEGNETYSLFGRLERANLNYWTTHVTKTTAL
jgi:hypothetical protein